MSKVGSGHKNRQKLKWYLHSTISAKVVTMCKWFLTRLGRRKMVVTKVTNSVCILRSLCANVIVEPSHLPRLSEYDSVIGRARDDHSPLCWEDGPYSTSKSNNSKDVCSHKNSQFPSNRINVWKLNFHLTKLSSRWNAAALVQDRVPPNNPPLCPLMGWSGARQCV